MIEAVNAFTAPGRWFRGNTHTHSTVSDGDESLEARFDRYRKAGYDFLVMTDHGQVSDVARFSEDGFLAISGSELHPANPYGGDFYHIVAVNITEPIDFTDLHPQEVLDAVSAQGGASIMAHPYWSGFVLEDYRELTGYCALEVFNQICEIEVSKGYSENTWDNHLDRLGAIWGVAADDAHHIDPDTGKGWINIRATELTPESIVGALHGGAFYSTQGPELLDVRIEGSGNSIVVVAKCSPAKTIAFKAQGRLGTVEFAEPGGLLESARYECIGTEKYIRVEVVDEAGRKAWSNPIFLTPQASL